MDNVKKLLIYTYRRPAVVLAYIWQKLSPAIPPKLYLDVMFRLQMGYWMDFKNPQTFNEKLQWLKINDHQQKYIAMVDKFQAKEYVAKIIGEKYIIPTLGVWDNVDEIDFDKLPNQFVLKCTHDSGGLVICKDKSSLDIESAKQKLKKSLKTNYYHKGKELPYKFVRRQIIAEQYLSDSKKELFDYKFFCFSGKVKFFKVDYGRFTEHHANYYSPAGDLLEFGEKSIPFKRDADIVLPTNLSLMIELSEKLSTGIPFLRVDFYNVSGKILFGELTFYPASGFGKFEPDGQDLLIGKLLKIGEQ